MTLVDFFGQLKLQFQLDSCPLNLLPACCGNFLVIFLCLCATVERKPIKNKSHLAVCVGCGSCCEGAPGLVGLAVKSGAGTVSLGSAALPARRCWAGAGDSKAGLFSSSFFFVSTVLGYIVFVHFSLLTQTESKMSHIFVSKVMCSAA